MLFQITHLPCPPVLLCYSCATLPELHHLILSASPAPLAITISSTATEPTAAFNGATASHALYRLAKMAQRYGPASRRRGGGPAGRNGPPLYTEQMRRHAWDNYVQPALSRLQPLMSCHAELLSAWDVSLALWAFATLGVYDRDAFQRLGDRGVETLAAFVPADCAHVLVAFARFEHTHPSLLQGVTQVRHMLRLAAVRSMLMGLTGDSILVHGHPSPHHRMNASNKTVTGEACLPVLLLPSGRALSPARGFGMSAPRSDTGAAHAENRSETLL